MSSLTRRLVTKAVAVVVIVTLLDAAGIPPLMMLLVTGAILVVWVVSRRSQAREVDRIFEFYIAADAILREEERRWYGFEIAEVIEQGEESLELMTDSPPVHLFALAALHHRIANHQTAERYLSHLLEDEKYDELHQNAPSRQLRRYVSTLRRIERDPSVAPQALSAVRNLERARKKYAMEILEESRNSLAAINHKVASDVTAPSLPAERVFSTATSLSSVSPPPPISEVLHDVYHDDSVTSH
jgi:hypothetical protein